MKVTCIDDSWTRYPGRYSLPDGPLLAGQTYEVVQQLEHTKHQNVLSYRLEGKRVIDLETGNETGFLQSRFVAAEYYEAEFCVSHEPIEEARRK